MDILEMIVDELLGSPAELLHDLIWSVCDYGTFMYYAIGILAFALLYYFASHGYVWYKRILSFGIGVFVFALMFLILGLNNVPKFVTILISLALALFLAVLTYKYLEKINGILWFVFTLLVGYFFFAALFKAEELWKNIAAFIIALIIAVIVALLIVKYTKPFIILLMGIYLGKVSGELLSLIFDFSDFMTVITQILVSFHAIFHQIRLYDFLSSPKGAGEFDYKEAYNNLQRISSTDENQENEKTPENEDNTSYYGDRVTIFVRRTYNKFVRIRRAVISKLLSVFNLKSMKKLGERIKDLFSSVVPKVKEFYKNNKRVVIITAAGLMGCVILIVGIVKIVSFVNEKKAAKDDSDTIEEYYDDSDYEIQEEKTEVIETPEEPETDLESEQEERQDKEERLLEEYVSNTSERILGQFFAGSGEDVSMFAALGPANPDFDCGYDTMADSYCRVINIDDNGVHEIETIDLIEETETDGEKTYTPLYFSYDDIIRAGDDEIYCVNIDERFQYKYLKKDGDVELLGDTSICYYQNESGIYADTWFPCSMYESDKNCESVEVVFDDGCFKQYRSQKVNEEQVREEFANYDEVLAECQNRLNDIDASEVFFVDGSIENIEFIDVKKGSNNKYYFTFSYEVTHYEADIYSPAFKRYSYLTYDAKDNRLVADGTGINLTFKTETSHLAVPIFGEENTKNFSNADEVLDAFIEGKIPVNCIDRPVSFYITEMEMNSDSYESYSIGERLDLDNDGENELILNGPYGGIYLDVRNNQVFIFAAGDGTVMELSYVYFENAYWIIYSDVTHQGREMRLFKKFNGGDMVVDSFDLNAEYWNQDWYDENSQFTYKGQSITMEQYEAILQSIFS